MKQEITKNGTTWGAEVDKLNGNFDELYTSVAEALGDAQSAQQTADDAVTPGELTTALSGYIPSSQKGATNGVASLVNGTVPAYQLPSYVDDVLESANLAAFPATGETGKLYVAIDTNLVYRWSGSTYTRVDQTDLTNYYNKSQVDTLLATKRDIASTFLTGGVITFDKDKTFNTYDAPFGGTLSYDLTNAVAGVRATVYFNGSAVPGPAVEEGGNLLAVGQVNKLVFTYLGNNRIVYQITSLNRGTTTDIKLVATGTTTTSTTLADIAGLATTLPLNSKFLMECEGMIMCDGAGGVGFAAVFPTLAGINYLLMDGATTNTTYGRQPMSASVGGTKFAAVASSTRFPIRIMGYIETTTDGAFKLQFASTTAGQQSTVFLGSWVRFTKVG